jgi:hypothetical protein
MRLDPTTLTKPDYVLCSNCISNALIGKIHQFLGTANRIGGHGSEVLLFSIQPPQPVVVRTKLSIKRVYDYRGLKPYRLYR